MDIKTLRRRIKYEEEDPDGLLGIAVFMDWAQYQVVGEMRHERLYSIGNRMGDAELEELWARFCLEADETSVANSAIVYQYPENDHDSDCCCSECAENRAAEAEYYAEMRRDR